MTRDELQSEAERLERQLDTACADQRLSLQPQISAVVARMEETGHAVPQRLRRLEAALTDEAVEAKFDNMPI